MSDHTSSIKPVQPDIEALKQRYYASGTIYELLRTIRAQQATINSLEAADKAMREFLTGGVFRIDLFGLEYACQWCGHSGSDEYPEHEDDCGYIKWRKLNGC